MTENTNTIVLTAVAAAIVTKDVAAFKADGKRYSAYVTEMAVTADTVAAHVALFREAYKASVTTKKNPTPDPAAVKAYATKVRNGLNYWVAKDETTTDETPVNLLTKDGLSALADLDADQMMAAIRAEIARRNA